MAYHDPKTSSTVNTGPDHRVITVQTARTQATRFEPGGRARHIDRILADGSRMVVDVGVRGDRHIEVVRPGGERVVAVGRQGFVERPLRPGFVARTYVARGLPTAYVYRTYSYHGVAYYRYVPRVQYAPAFYQWAYQPWPAPVAYNWGWGPAPWFYEGYFVPSPGYANAGLWLTDYLLAENLRLAYDNQSAPDDDLTSLVTPPASPGDSTLTPAVKLMIAEQVRQQIQEEQDAASQPVRPQPPPSALDPNQRTFVISATLDVTTDNGMSCELTGGDIIFRTGELQGDGKVGVTVLNSKPGDCDPNSVTAVELAALQEMQNQFREQIAAGMEKLSSNQGKGNLPAGPVANPTQVPDGQAPPAANAQSLLTQFNQEADQAETEIKQAVSG
jgi:hypothetical protein